MKEYLENLNPTLKEYFNILSKDFPEFLIEYINTPRMQKQAGISISCGTYYTKMFNPEFWYSSLDHSIAVALIIWNFTHDKKQTLAGLFHDISTPAFKHCIDFMNKDYEKQESTEELTKTMILESEEIMSLLKKDNIDINEISDYQIYPIADNDTPMLSADRLEYTLSNGLGAIKKVWNLEDVNRIYSNIKVFIKDDGVEELGFLDSKIAEEFVQKMSELSVYYMNDKRRFSMQFLADTMKIMSENNIITLSDLYSKSEKEIIEKIEKCDKFNISKCFNIWKNGTDIKTSNTLVKDKYCINIKAKKRYINPLVKIDENLYRINEISNIANERIEICKNYDFNRYLYMDFNFDI